MNPLVIRHSQMEAFRFSLLGEFRQWMVLHIQKHFPERTVGWSDEVLRAFVDEGVRHALSYGILAETALCKFIDVRVLLGSTFDKDPAYPWAARTLHDESILSPDARVELLVIQAQGYLARRP